MGQIHQACCTNITDVTPHSPEGRWTVPQQHSGHNCVFESIAHGLPHSHTAKSLRAEVIQFLEAGTNRHIGGDTVKNWIQPAQGHHGNQTTVAEYMHALKEEGLGGDFEIAITAEIQQTRLRST